MFNTFDFGDGAGPVPAHRHTNPDKTMGGIVADTAHVDPTVYVGFDARVFQNARVRDNAVIYDSAQIYGNARVYNCARIYDRARIYGNARIYDNVQISGDTRIFEKAEIWNFVRVFREAWVFGDAKICNRAEISGNAHICGKTQISTNCKIKGQALISKNEDLIHILTGDRSITAFPDRHKVWYVAERDRCLSIPEWEIAISVGTECGYEDVMMEKTINYIKAITGQSSQ